MQWLVRRHFHFNSNVETGRNLLPVSPGTIVTRAALILDAQTCPPQACTGTVFAKCNPNVHAEAERKRLRLMLPARKSGEK